ncbi:MAG TPA: hypothetical protein PLO59_05360, partial [Bacteroidia bacterium]|nr:hypothetical protein [Bacteroidia bacterium]
SKLLPQPPSDFIANISQVWIDTVDNKRKLVLANIEGSNTFMGTDAFYGDEGIINLNGTLKGFKAYWTVMIKNKPKDFPRRYISYQATITDTAETHKRMIAFSVLDTLYLKALPLPPLKK